MMQRKVKTIGIALATCIFLTVFFSSCGRNNSSSAEGRTGINQNMNLTGLPVVKEREVYSMLIPKNFQARNNMEEKEAVINAVRDTNIEINWTEIPRDTWEERLNILFASADLPDAIVQPPQGLFMQNLMLFTDLTDLIAPYTPVLSNYLTERPDVKALITTPNGRIYCLPAQAEASWALTYDGLFINKPWLDKLGLSVPTTTDEFYNMLKAFKENDVNGNGDRNDEIPFAFCQSWDGKLGSMFGSFGILDNDEHLQVINGVVTFTPARPEFLEALRYFNRLYSEGLIDEEGFSQSSQQYTAKGMEQPTVYGSLITNLIGNVVGAGNSDFIPVPALKGPGGRQLWNISRSTGMNAVGLVISNKCRSPETLVRWYDYINSSFAIALLWDDGPANLAWVWEPDGKWRTTSDLLPEGMTWGQARHTGGVGTSGPQFPQIYGMNTTASRNIDDITTLTKLQSLALMEPFLPPVLPMGLEEANVLQERAILFADIDSYVRNFVATSIMQGITDAQWAAHLQNVERLNIPAYVQPYQALYDRSR